MAEIETLSKQKWRAIPLVRGAINAALYLAVMIGFDLWLTGELRDDWLQFALLLTAASFLLIDPIDGASLARAQVTKWSPDGLMYAFHMCCAFAVPLIIALWMPDEPVWRNPVIFGVAGVIFGLLMTHSFDPAKAAYLRGGIEAVRPFYRDSSAAFGSGYGRKLYLFWPFLVVGFMALLFSQDREPGYGQLNALMLMVLFTTLYAPRDAKYFFFSPRLPGTLLFFGAIATIYATSFV